MRTAQRSGLMRAVSRLDDHAREVLTLSAFAMVLKVTGVLLAFAVNWVIARRLQTSGAGVYYLAYSTVMITAALGQVGLEKAVIRFVASDAAAGNWAGVRGVTRQGVLTCAFSSLLVTGVLLWITPWLASAVYKKPELELPLRVMALGVVPFNLMILYASALTGLKRIVPAMIVNGLVIPGLSLPLMWSLAGRYHTVGATAAYVSSAVAAALLGFALWQRRLARLATERRSVPERDLLRTALPMWWIAVVSIVHGQVSTLILGAHAASGEVGIFGIAVRVAALTGLVLMALVAVVMPKFSALYAQDDPVALQRLLTQVVRGAALVGVLIVFPLMTAPGYILSLFGEGFRSGGTVLRILAAGQLINVATGPVGALLLMSGHERVQAANVSASAVLNIGLCLWLIPRHGITGAAIAAACAVSVSNLCSVALVYKFLRLRPW